MMRSTWAFVVCHRQLCHRAKSAVAQDEKILASDSEVKPVIIDKLGDDLLIGKRVEVELLLQTRPTTQNIPRSAQLQLHYTIVSLVRFESKFLSDNLVAR